MPTSTYIHTTKVGMLGSDLIRSTALEKAKQLGLDHRLLEALMALIWIDWKEENDYADFRFKKTDHSGMRPSFLARKKSVTLV